MGMFTRFKKNWRWRTRHAAFVRSLAKQVEKIVVTGGEDAYFDGLVRIRERLEREAKSSGFMLANSDEYKSAVATFRQKKDNRDSVSLMRNFITSVLSSRHGNAVEKCGSESALENERRQATFDKDTSYCNDACKGRHSCTGHVVCEFCGEAVCGCDASFVGGFDVCDRCQQKIKEMYKT